MHKTRAEEGWFAVRLEAYPMAAAAEKLRRKSLEEFVPRRGGRHPLLLFPGIVFCRLGKAGRAQACGCADPAAIPVEAAQLSGLRRMLASGLPVEPWPYAPGGQAVQVSGGRLSGLSGRLWREPNVLRVVLNFEPLRRAVAVAIRQDQVCALEGRPDAQLARLYLTA